MAKDNDIPVIHEFEVLRRLLSWAVESSNVRAIVLNGSRGDPSRNVDELSDFDVAVFVRDLDQVIDDRWLDDFGPVMVRWPLSPRPTFDETWITQLVLFRDGVRIDFQFTLTSEGRAVERPAEYFCILIDKDNLSERLIPEIVPGTSIEPPSPDEFADRINAFWWDIPYVAKALRRGELNYAKFVLDSDIRFKKVQPLLSWSVGCRHGWQTNVGVFGRWLQHYLEPEIWQSYLETFSGEDIEDNWRAMFATCRLVRILGQELAAQLAFEYPDDVDEAVSAYLRSVRDHWAESSPRL